MIEGEDPAPMPLGMLSAKYVGGYVAQSNERNGRLTLGVGDVDPCSPTFTAIVYIRSCNQFRCCSRQERSGNHRSDKVADLTVRSRVSGLLGGSSCPIIGSRMLKKKHDSSLTRPYTR